MIVSFDTNVLIYATAPTPIEKGSRARDVIVRGARSGSSILLLQALTEFSSVALRKAGISIDEVRVAINAWRAVVEVRAAEESDLSDALTAVKAHKLSFWDAMLWATARRVGVRYLLTEDFQDGFELDGVRFVDPFRPANDPLIDEILPAR
jgi:predicted nucleic acid-binding protein